MEQFYYQGTAVVENAVADCHSLLKASALLRYVEQISSMHARKFGMDDKFFEDHGVAFLVGKQALRFNRVPRRGETLTLCSRSEKALRGSIKRITTLTDEAGQEVAMADSPSRTAPGGKGPGGPAAGSCPVLRMGTSCASRAGR